MLDFFRRHQRYFFVIITIVIVISFSFFGTFNSMNTGSFREQIAFRTVDGTDITRHELDEMVVFLSTDSEDKQYFGGVWGLNFLNDGVIKKNFFQTPLAPMLLKAYANDIMPDFVSRQEKEKKYSLYSHPQAKFIGIETAWNHFVPQMTSNYQHLHASNDPLSTESIQARIALFTLQKQLPPALLRRVLKSQEAQYGWLTPDQNLDYMDLSVFGYHTLEDWFGPRFVRLVSQFIINAAEIAEKRGYYVAKAEASADLMRNAEISFKQNQRNPKLKSANIREYYDEQLRHLGMDHNTAVKVWRQVLLFRRLFQDMGHSMFVDPQMFEGYETYALASVDGEIYRLPQALRFHDYTTLQKFEIYLDSVAKRNDQDKTLLKLPETFLTVTEIAKKHPELVQKRYLLDVAHIDKNSLEANISLKETWAWEVQEANWLTLKKQFPELGKANADTIDAKYIALDALDDKTKARVDHFSRLAIIDQHLEWIDNALQSAEPSRQTVGLHEKGTNLKIIGLKDAKALMALLDKDSPAQELSRFTIDHQHYYKINVIDKTTQADVLTFAEANEQGIMDAMLDQILDDYYVKIRDTNVKEFQREDKTWKPLSDVKTAIADRYFEKLIRDISQSYASANSSKQAPEKMIGDYAATLRLYAYMKEIRALFAKDPAIALNYINNTVIPVETVEAELITKLAANKPLNEQWKLNKEGYHVVRNNADTLLDKSELFTLSNDQWTQVNTPGNGDLNFFHVLNKGMNDNQEATSAHSSALAARQLLSDNAEESLMAQLLNLIDEKKAISLEYLSLNKVEAD